MDTGKYIPKTAEDIPRLADQYIREVSDENGEIYKKSYKLHERVTIPTTFRNEFEKKQWWGEQFRRCRMGHDGMAPVMYFYYNFCYILTPQGRKIRPQYYRSHNDFFWEVEHRLRGEKKGRGIILLKRRRWGFSWGAEAILLHEALFYNNANIGQQSKSEKDVESLFEKLKFIYYNLPPEMQVRAKYFSKERIYFASTKVVNGRKVESGRQSSIMCKTPVDTAWEGQGLKIWYADEAGKVPNIGAIWRMTEPALAGEDGFTREGLAIIGGTAGDIDSTAFEFARMWKDAESEDLDRIFIPGWANLLCDEFGNEDVRAQVIEILKKRLAKVNHPRALYQYMQQYPLTIEEALMVNDSPVFDVISLSNQKSVLDNHPPSIQVGKFQWQVEGKSVRFIPDPHGKVQIIQHPVDGCDYLAGADPYDHKKLRKGRGSHGALLIAKMQTKLSEEQKVEIQRKLDVAVTTEEQMQLYLQLGDLPVLYYRDNPNNPEEYYEQSLMALVYYSRKSVTQVLIERNRYGMISWFERNGFTQFMKRRTAKVDKQFDKVRPGEFGEHIDETQKGYRTDLIALYILKMCNRIYFPDLIDNMTKYDPDVPERKYDDVDAFGMMLMAKNDRRLTFNQAPTETKFVKPSYVMVNGRVQYRG